MIAPLNLYDVALEGHPGDHPGSCDRMADVGPSIGAAKLGGSVYEIDPGESVCPYHYEGVEEEWLLVLTGSPTLRDPDGEHELDPGDVVCFPPGPGGAHKVTNRSESVVRILMLSTIPENGTSICVYPDNDEVGVWPWPGRRLRLSDPMDDGDDES